MLLYSSPLSIAATIPLVKVIKNAHFDDGWTALYTKKQIGSWIMEHFVH